MLYLPFQLDYCNSLYVDVLSDSRLFIVRIQYKMQLLVFSLGKENRIMYHQSWARSTGFLSVSELMLRCYCLS